MSIESLPVEWMEVHSQLTSECQVDICINLLMYFCETDSRVCDTKKTALIIANDMLV